MTLGKCPRICIIVTVGLYYLVKGNSMCDRSVLVGETSSYGDMGHTKLLAFDQFILDCETIAK